MVSIMAGSGTHVRIAGHGLTIDNEFCIGPGITVSPEIPRLEPSAVTTMGELHKSTTILVMEQLASFSLLVEEPAGGEALACKAWNALWVFSLLALACRAPAFSLYSVTEDKKFTLANRNLVIRPLARLTPIKADNVKWVVDNHDRYDALLDNDQFRTSMRYYNNAHYLFDDDAKIMLLWAGIEGLLDVEAELSRRIALHASILFDGSQEQKAVHFAQVKKAYNIRSKVVHGAGANAAALSAAYDFASDLLIGLLRKMVDLGRVPTALELDQLAVSPSIS